MIRNHWKALWSFFTPTRRMRLWRLSSVQMVSSPAYKFCSNAQITCSLQRWFQELKQPELKSSAQMTSVSAANSVWTNTIRTLALVGLLLYLDQLFHAFSSLQKQIILTSSPITKMLIDGSLKKQLSQMMVSPNKSLLYLWSVFRDKWCVYGHHRI